ncbi:type IV secretion system coupling TraD/TrwB family protein [Litoreibacter meonggei]|uniref:Type IV secretion system coupling TraD/TrwB family protein n=1 Tax=Litoreibacter meonggei TaxID=1049199 RepID=A0A497VRI7_9RHOB|nr:type IV secretion system DNA-binding domain-containing protein [Litoreibacter meonggei]RLJ40689.1 type IV secretion system coupling TraD/TrwB family protein [Litoreibacter meonggei]
MQTNDKYTLGLAYRRYHPPGPFGLETKDRLQHLYVIGQTGTGKSTLLHNLALQDAQSGTGFCLIDPHGDLAENLHRDLSVPHKYWDVSDPACPLGYNPLAKVSALHRPLVASGLIETLKKQWPDAWGARMEHILRFSLLALLEQPEADLRDVLKLLTYKGFRRQVVDRITDPQVQFFWKTEFPAMNYQGSADGVAPIANKLGAFLAQPAVRTALCEPDELLRFRHMMDTGQVLIVNLAKGRLGADITNILGGLITSTIMLAASTRHGLPEPARRPFFLYVDEFPNLTTKSFADMLSEARKYGLGLVLAHQYLSQTDNDVADAVFGNVGNLVAFRVGAKDAPLLARLMPNFAVHDLQNQPNYRAAVQVMHRGQRLVPFSASMYSPYRGGG